MEFTLPFEDALIEKAREAAAKQGASLEGLVIRYIESLAGWPQGLDLAMRMEVNWREADAHFQEHPPKKRRLSREELYAERLDRIAKGKK